MASRLTVLLAEDDENDVILIRRAFAKLALLKRLAVVTDGEQAIPYLRGDGPYAERQAHPFPDLLILDRRMPLLFGLDVLFWLRTEPRFERLPVVVLSNGFSPTEIDMVRRLNAAPCLKTAEFQEMPLVLEQGIASAIKLVAVPGK